MTGSRTAGGDSLTQDVVREIVELFPGTVTLARALRDEAGQATDLVVEYLNAAARAALADPDAALGGRASRLWPEMLHNGSIKTCLQVLETGVEASGEVWWTDPDGRRGTYDYRVVGIGPDHLLWVMRDNADSVRRLAEDRQRFAAAFHAAPVGLALIDGKGRLTDVNYSLAALIGVDPEQLHGRSFTDLVDPLERAEVTADLAALCDGRIDRVEQEWRLLSTDDTSTCVRVALALVRDVDGAPLHSVAHVVDVSRAKQVEAQLSRAATHDALTGLPNRVLLLNHLELAAERGHSTGGRSCLLVIDVDHFKVVNDSLGHAAGDELLQTVATRLQDAVPAGELVARLGGDEFAVVYELDRLDQHADGAERLCRHIARSLSTPCKIGGRPVVVQISIGVAFVDRHTTAAELLRDADLALYEAKRRGRNTFAVFNDSLRARALDRMETESGMRAGLAADEFLPFYQPVVDLASSAVVGLEALARWRRHGRFLTPGTFLHVAEEAGLMVALSEQIVSRAAADLARWRDDDREQLRQLSWLSVNASPTQLHQPSFATWLEGVLEAHAIPGNHLVVEITEDSLLTGNPASWRSLAHLRELGCKVAIDDFGTGYSSLAYLRQLPVDILKLDRVFVSGAAHDAKDRALLKTFVDLGDALGLTVVAEGVETAEQLQMLRDCGCVLAQGYGLGRPAPPEIIERVLAGGSVSALLPASLPMLARTGRTRD